MKRWGKIVAGIVISWFLVCQNGFAAQSENWQGVILQEEYSKLLPEEIKE